MSWVPRIGSEFAGYRIESLLGHGGMSIVYRAEHLSLGRTVALKLLAPQLSEDEGFRERFTRESRLAASLDHPHIIPIYEAGEEEETFWIAMRYVAGSDVKNLLRRDGPLDLDRAVDIIIPVASALGAAHGKGLVHRDVKPANILLAGGDGPEGEAHVYLSDFGVAKHSASRALTKTGIFVGTAEYASPEQIEGKQLDGRADIYSLGCVLYECLTGAPVYDKDSEVALMYAHLLEPPPLVTAVRPDLPPEVDELVAKAMAKSRDDRFATAREFASEARNIAGRGTRAGATSAATSTERPPTQETVVAAATTHAPTGEGEGPAAPVPPASTGGGASGPGARDWRKLAIVAGVVALLALAAIPVALLIDGGDSKTIGTNGVPPPPPPPPAPIPPPPPTSLLGVLMPTQIASGCTTAASPSPGAVETNDCTPAEGAPTSLPNKFQLSFFPDQLTLNAAYQQAKDDAEETGCSGTVGERVWIHVKTGKRGGRRTCALDAEGDFLVIWTHEKLDAPDHVDMLGIAEEPGRSPTIFASWWNAINDDVGKCRPKVSEETCAKTIADVTNQ